jgi:death-on-curing protein
VRDFRSLESDLARPFATFDNKYLYPSPSDKVAAIIKSILINHPFVDGNKRTAYVLMKLILFEFGLDVEATQDEKYEMVVASSMGDMRFDDIKTWMDSRLRKKIGR